MAAEAARPSYTQADPERRRALAAHFVLTGAVGIYFVERPRHGVNCVAGKGITMPSYLFASVGQRSGGEAVRYSMRAATVCHGDATVPVHLVASDGRSLLAYGAERLRAGSRIVLTVDGVELAARVSWSEGRRCRLDAEPGEDGERWQVAHAPHDHATRGGAANNDAAEPFGVADQHAA